MKLKRKKEIFIHCITIDFIAFHIFKEKIILQFVIFLSLIHFFCYNLRLNFQGNKMQDLIINENSIKDKIYTIRNMQVMLDRDLAELYCVETKRITRLLKIIKINLWMIFILN